MTHYESALIAAYVSAGDSPDPSTQNGVLLLDRDGTIIPQTVARNEFPRGVAYTPERFERPLKYSIIEHGERNAIFAAAKHGICTDGLTMVAAWAACADCARAIVQAGISTLVRHMPPSDDESSKRWLASIEIGDTILNEGGVRIIEIHDPLPDAPKIRRDGQLWQP